MGKFLIRQTRKGYKFDLLATNGQVIASSETYNTEAACRNGIKSIVTCAPVAPVADLTEEGARPANPRFELYADKSGQYRFRLKARNGRIIAVSESYKAKGSCENGIESVRKNAADGETEKY